MRVLKWLGLTIVGLLIAGVGYLWVAPPDLLRVGANYTAKMVCSNVFVAGRDADEVLAVDVQAPGHPLLRLMQLKVDRDMGVVEASLLGFIAPGMAVYRGPALGCSSLPSLDMADLAELDAAAITRTPALDDELPWPRGSRVEPQINEKLDAALNDASLIGPGMRAVVVVKNGQIVGERYGDGFDAETPLLGWSATKTVTAALIGRAMREGLMEFDTDPGWAAWESDERASIALVDFMGMASDLMWNEGYGSVSDVTRMLYLETDMAAFVASQPIDATSATLIGETFNYSSGTTVILNEVLERTFDDPAAALDFPHRALFAPLGMTSAVLETDASGTFVGSSYLYATARDWARLGQFLMQRGVWEGRSLLPTGYVDWMTEPHPASNEGAYGRGQV
ncbi:MAG: serine hydrolase, partial [Pseudomonadota bacterium]